MIDLIALAARTVPQVITSLRTAHSQHELANSLTGEQGWARKVIKRRDGFELIASQTARTLRADRSAQLELEGTHAQWDAIAGDIGLLLYDAFSSKTALLNLLRDPELGMQRVLDFGGQNAIDTLRAEEPATTRFTTVLSCSVSVVIEVVRYANWFDADATVDQMRSQLRVELLAKETLLLIKEMRIAAAKEYQTPSWPAEAAVSELDSVPEYYPRGLSNRDLAKDLLVTRIDDLLNLAQSDHEDLYWGGRLYGKAEPLEAVLTDAPITVILGNPGSGKSTLAKDLVVREIEANKAAAFAHLADLASILIEGKFLTGGPDAIAAIANAMTRAISANVTPDFLSNSAPSGQREDEAARPILVLDGFDEIPSAAGRSAVIKLVYALADLDYRVVVTSRITGYGTPLRRATHVAVLPLMEAAAASVAERWFALSGSHVARDRYEQTMREENLSTLTGNPLMLGFMCFVAHHQDVPSDRASVFERFVDHFLRRKWHHPTQWVEDDAQVAYTHRAAASVAWAMATHKQNEIQSLWNDSEILGALEDSAISPDAPYETYMAGLLVPHGLQESPFSRRFQRVRWIHRSIHEYFAATVLARSIQLRPEGWWESLRTAALHPSWPETMHLSCQLIGDGEGLHKLIETLVHEIQEGDTADFALTDSLALVSRYCHCADRRSQVAKLMTHGFYWHYAFDFDSHLATDVAIEVSSHGGDLTQIGSALRAQSTENSISAGDVERMLSANILDMDIAEHAASVWAVRLSSDFDKWWPSAIEFARNTGDISFVRDLPELEPQELSRIADSLIGLCRESATRFSGTEIADFDSRLLNEIKSRTSIPNCIELGLEIRRLYDHEDSDFAALAKMMPGSQHPRDLEVWGPLLMAHTNWEPLDEEQRSWVDVGRAAHYLSAACGSVYRADWRLDPGDDISVDALPTAEEIINRLPGDREFSTVELVDFLWALRVLVRFPSSRVYDSLVALQGRGRVPMLQHVNFASIDPLDWADFITVVNWQDWATLADMAFQDISQNRRLGRSGAILCVAASIWAAPANLRIRTSDYHAVSPERVEKIWLKGLRAQLRDESDPDTIPEVLMWLPEELTDDIRIRIAANTLKLTLGSLGPVAAAARVGAERALAATGALSSFYDQVVVRRRMDS